LANTCVISRDPENQKLVIEVVDELGDIVATAGRIVVGLLDVADAPVGYREALFRETKGCDDAGNPVYAMFLRTKWYPTAVRDDQD
jgi:hypothetical protein